MRPSGTGITGSRRAISSKITLCPSAVTQLCRKDTALEAAGLKGQLLNDDDAATENHVSLGTMHRAKGLEFKAVAIVGCDLGVLPLRSVLDGMVDLADQTLFVEQERNLLYVALTRAREQVLVTHTSRPSVLLAKIGS
jgi:superfamily I DNA/RNA helicase